MAPIRFDAVHHDLDAVLFDFAGVLVHLPISDMAEHAAQEGMSVREMLATMVGPLDVDTDHPWHRLERGEISWDAFTTELTERLRADGHTGLRPPPHPARLGELMRPCDEMIAAARDARTAGYRTAIVTNNIREFTTWRELVGADDLVDVVVDSAYVGMRKPNPSIFLRALSELGGIDPSRALFLDDFEWNIAGASRAGLRTMHVVEPVAAACQLRATLHLV